MARVHSYLFASVCQCPDRGAIGRTINRTSTLDMNRIKQRHKTGGRATGTPNKYTQEMRDRLRHIFEQYAEGQLQLDIKDTDPETRLRFMLEVAKLITPKPPTQETEDDQNFNPIIISLGNGTKPD